MGYKGSSALRLGMFAGTACHFHSDRKPELLQANANCLSLLSAVILPQFLACQLPHRTHVWHPGDITPCVPSCASP